MRYEVCVDEFQVMGCRAGLGLGVLYPAIPCNFLFSCEFVKLSQPMVHNMEVGGTRDESAELSHVSDQGSAALPNSILSLSSF